MSLTDTLGSLAVATHGYYMTGVSVDIGTSFVKPGGRAGDELIAKAVITGIGALQLPLHLRCCPQLTEEFRALSLSVHPGKSLAYTRVDFYNAQGQLAAYGRECTATRGCPASASLTDRRISCILLDQRPRPTSSFPSASHPRPPPRLC